MTRYSAIGQFLFPVPSSREFITPDGHGFFAHTHKADQLQVIFGKGKKKGHLHSIFLLLHANRDFYIAFHSQCS